MIFWTIFILAFIFIYTRKNQEKGILNFLKNFFYLNLTVFFELLFRIPLYNFKLNRNVYSDEYPPAIFGSLLILILTGIILILITRINIIRKNK
jgi:hypothetical protein